MVLLRVGRAGERGGLLVHNKPKFNIKYHTIMRMRLVLTLIRAINRNAGALFLSTQSLKREQSRKLSCVCT